MAVLEIARIQVRRGQELQTGIPQLEPGEFGWAEDTENLYIGKRIAEGAVTDTNTRILTENDLNFFTTIATNTYTVSSSYRYRAGTEYIESIRTTVQDKLDSFNPNLNDFAKNPYAPVPSGTDITDIFRSAIQTIFLNSTNLVDARRQLIIPPGDYIVSDVIQLPPFASITGSGPGLTNITFISTASNLFQTIDAQGNTYEDNTMQSGQDASQYVNISNMTLKFSSLNTTSFSLISLDNVKNARVDNVELITNFDQASTTTYGLVVPGDLKTGIQIRGQGDLGGNDNLCQNIIITNCVFDGLYQGVKGVGTVVHPVIENSLFSNLTQGTTFLPGDSIPGPTNGVIKNNRFQNILQQAILMNANPNDNQVPTGHVSSENYFSNVGNGNTFTDLTTGTGTAVITFLGSQDRSVNDQFNRKIIANTTTATDFYYNPLIDGNISVNDTALYSLTMQANSTVTMTKIPLIKKDQLISILYLMTNETLSRKGNLLINISASGIPDVVDNHSFSEGPHPVVLGVAPVLGESGHNVFAVNVLQYPQFINNPITNGDWYIQAHNAYPGKQTKILSTATGVNPNIMLVYTDTADNFAFAPYSATVTQNVPPGSTTIPVNSISDITIGDTVTWPGDPEFITFHVLETHDNNGDPYIMIGAPTDNQIYQDDVLIFNKGSGTETYSLNTIISYPINFFVNNNNAASGNYISVNCVSTNPVESIQLKYQINILG
jgi:hypothetical protein